ncbi:hypothetical protein FXV83_13065 [Bradyrhizobium hipponense]|uniref:Uncharacterized protein n=1 Tax=Bradyrhizobium hipponense TaxID=2605638 RepID=A0A5S4YNY7_9BRAD|nr:hypothetical protein [Bradyrhizobium hipponense]TYO66116.1 hypothetical protein FXV83_13065 [Bradyrhizobium hipponense]
MKLARLIQISAMLMLPRPSRAWPSRGLSSADGVSVSRQGQDCSAPGTGWNDASQEVLRTMFEAMYREPFQQIGLADLRLQLKRGDLTPAADAQAVFSELTADGMPSVFARR